MFDVRTLINKSKCIMFYTIIENNFRRLDMQSRERAGFRISALFMFSRGGMI